MDATCNVQDSIHVFHLVHNMCPGFWVHIISSGGFFVKRQRVGLKIVVGWMRDIKKASVGRTLPKLFNKFHSALQ